MKVGDRVRVIKSVVVYHHPQHKKQPFDVKGLEGEVIEIITEWQGRTVSANLPFKVQFDKRFTAHFKEGEIETVVGESEGNS
jgi:Ferredoxin thioredoxin reductase variable alpha chain